MPDVRKIIVGMENAVNETAELAAALRLLAFANREEGLADADRAGLHRLAGIVQESAESVLRRWHELDAATSPTRGGR